MKNIPGIKLKDVKAIHRFAGRGIIFIGETAEDVGNLYETYQMALEQYPEQVRAVMVHNEGRVWKGTEQLHRNPRRHDEDLHYFIERFGDTDYPFNKHYKGEDGAIYLDVNMWDGREGHDFYYNYNYKKPEEGFGTHCAKTRLFMTEAMFAEMPPNTDSDMRFRLGVQIFRYTK